MKIIKFLISIILIFGMTFPANAFVYATDGSTFVTKAEFDSTMADFNSRLTSFESGINSKIDSQVSTYLDRNGIWSGKQQEMKDIVINHTGYSATNYNVYYIGPTNALYSGVYPNVCGYVGQVNKSGLLYLATDDTLNTGTGPNRRRFYINDAYIANTTNFSENSLYLNYRFVILPNDKNYKKNTYTYSYVSGTTNNKAQGFGYYDDTLTTLQGYIPWDDPNNEILIEYQPYTCMVAPICRSSFTKMQVVLHFGSQAKVKNYVFVKKGQKLGFVSYFTYAFNGTESGYSSNIFISNDGDGTNKGCWLKTTITEAKIY